MEKLMRTVDSIPQAKVARSLFPAEQGQGTWKSFFYQGILSSENHPHRRLRYFPEKPCTAEGRTFKSLWKEIPGSAS